LSGERVSVPWNRIWRSRRFALEAYSLEAIINWKLNDWENRLDRLSGPAMHFGDLVSETAEELARRERARAVREISHLEGLQAWCRTAGHRVGVKHGDRIDGIEIVQRLPFEGDLMRTLSGVHVVVLRDAVDLLVDILHPDEGPCTYSVEDLELVQASPRVT